MKKLTCIFTLFTILSCVSYSELSNPESEKRLAQGGHGILIYSFSFDPEVKPQFPVYYSTFRSENLKGEYILSFNNAQKLRNSPLEDRENEKIYYHNLVLPAGDYFINQFYFQGYPKSYFQFTKIPFKISDNTITYIGNFHVTPFHGKNILGGKERAGGYYEINDYYKDDSAFFFKKYHLPKNFKLNKNVTIDYPIFDNKQK